MRAWFYLSLSVAIATPAMAQKDPFEKPIVIDNSLTPPIPATPTDGKVDGLGVDVFRTLQTLREKNPDSLTEADANEIKKAVLADGKIDAVERDLLDELVTSFYRIYGITITAAGAQPGDPVVKLFPVSQNAKRVLISVLRFDFPSAWAKGKEGWTAMIDESKKNEQERTRVVDFVGTMFAAEWAKGTQADAYKPLRDLLARHYGFVETQPDGRADYGKRILFLAMRKVDEDEDGRVPDFIYLWLYQPIGGK
jgi:hypothetical protein